MVARMKKFYPLLFVGIFALIVGYIELRLPVTVGAQGGDAVYQRLATGVLQFETPLTPTMTARLAATGTASEATFCEATARGWRSPGCVLGLDTDRGFNHVSNNMDRIWG